MAHRDACYDDILALPEYLVGEILSPSTAKIDRAINMPLYAREGVAHLWLVDPSARTLEVYALQDNRHWLLLDTLKEVDSVRQPPFDAIAFSLGHLWA
ncbi:Uma2 family endonuclease [Thiocystis violascens]|uniref:Uma2 family endonuclease n=1 Tax=Thiocystis violascens TaxID=73141 RepID=UPI00069492C7|nr:Uma2 family endonuclease [Thiocystis violascens]